MDVKESSKFILSKKKICYNWTKSIQKIAKFNETEANTFPTTFQHIWRQIKYADKIIIISDKIKDLQHVLNGVNV